jgi:hypothetical protein
MPCPASAGIRRHPPMRLGPLLLGQPGNSVVVTEHVQISAQIERGGGLGQRLLVCVFERLAFLIDQRVSDRGW